MGIMRDTAFLELDEIFRRRRRAANSLADSEGYVKWLENVHAGLFTSAERIAKRKGAQRDKDMATVSRQIKNCQLRLSLAKRYREFCRLRYRDVNAELEKFMGDNSRQIEL